MNLVSIYLTCKKSLTNIASPPCITVGTMQFSVICSEGVHLTNTLHLLSKSSNLDSSVHCTFFQSFKVQSLCCCVHCSFFNWFFFFFYRDFSTNIYPLNPIERSFLSTVITDIGWCIELNSAVNSGSFFPLFLLVDMIKCLSYTLDVTLGLQDLFCKH